MSKHSYFFCWILYLSSKDCIESVRMYSQAPTPSQTEQSEMKMFIHCFDFHWQWQGQRWKRKINDKYSCIPTRWNRMEQSVSVHDERKLSSMAPRTVRPTGKRRKFRFEYKSRANGKISKICKIKRTIERAQRRENAVFKFGEKSNETSVCCM